LSSFPNPFGEYCTIEAYLPKGIAKGEIIIYNLMGVMIQKYSIRSGYNAVTVMNVELPAPGIYFYTMVGDGRQFETQKMILTSR
jgi:hypothetical protein